MTDLSKGKIEIDGYTIDADTTSDDIKAHLNGSYAFYNAAPGGRSEVFCFENVALCGQSFKIRASFLNKRLHRLVLYAHFKGCPSFKELFAADCAWLKSVLGEPAESSSNDVLYKFEHIHVYATYMEDDGRSSPDEYIAIRY